MSIPSDSEVAQWLLSLGSSSSASSSSSSSASSSSDSFPADMNVPDAPEASASPSSASPSSASSASVYALCTLAPVSSPFSPPLFPPVFYRLPPGEKLDSNKPAYRFVPRFTLAPMQLSSHPKLDLSSMPCRQAELYENSPFHLCNRLGFYQQRILPWAMFHMITAEKCRYVP
jgi:hypothetical protein